MEENKAETTNKPDPKQELLDRYKIYLSETQNKDENYKWKAISHFQNTWDIEDQDFEIMFRNAFKKHYNLFYQNSWGFITKALKHFPDDVRAMFIKLYNNELELSERIDTFQKASERLLPLVKAETGKKNLNHAQDERTISVYLSFRFPEEYYIYKSSFYTGYCLLIGEQPKPAGEKFIHYISLANDLLNNYVTRDKELLEMHKTINPNIKWDDTHLIVQNIIYRMFLKDDSKAIERIETLLYQFADIADIWFKENTFIEERHHFFNDFKKRENIENANWQYFQQLGNNINAFATNALARTRALGKINDAKGTSENPIENYRENFIDLIFGDDPLDIRIDRFIMNVPYFSDSSVSELVGQFFPEEYVFYNKQDKQGIETLGIDIQVKRGDSFGKKFVKYNAAIKPLVSSYTDIVGKRTNSTLQLEVDQFLRFVSNLEIEKDEKELIRAFKEIGNETVLRSYFEYLTEIVMNSEIDQGNSRVEYTCPKKNNGGLVFQVDHRYLFTINKTRSELSNSILAPPNDLEALKESPFYKDHGSFGSSKKVDNPPIWVSFHGTMTSFPFVTIQQLEDSMRYQLDQTPIEYRDAKQSTNEAFEECVYNHEKLDQIIKKVFPSEISEPLPPYVSPDANYYWLNANPKQWTLDSLEQNPEIDYTTFTDSGTKRRIYKYMQLLKPGDKIIGYETTPIKKVKALLEVSRSLYINEENQEVFDMKLVEYTPTQPSWETLKGIPELANAEVMKNNQGSLFKLTNSEYEIIRSIAYSKPVFSKYGNEELLAEVFITPEKLARTLGLIRRKKNIILQGPPGTGKTFYAKRLGYCLNGEKDDNKVITIQFHQSYSYEDFIQGYRPDNGELLLKNGIFYDFAKKATRNPKNDYILIIDEINRGNLSKIFGELMLLIEADKRGEKVKLTYASNDGDLFAVPSNLHIIGTMNTADRSLALVDYALRRRFAFINMEPHFDEYFKEYLVSLGFKLPFIDDLIQMISTINEMIMGDPSLKEGFLIGHSYFVPNELPTNPQDWLDEIMTFEILPLLEEYWFDNDDRLSEAKNILGIIS